MNMMCLLKFPSHQMYNPKLEYAMSSALTVQKGCLWLNSINWQSENNKNSVTSLICFFQIRCITLLTIPSFSGKSGRHIVQAIITTTIITGPMANIITNIEEIMRMYSCSNSLTYNLSQARYDLLVKPFKIAFLNSKVNSFLF